jgi:anti-anti-sigma factor
MEVPPMPDAAGRVTVAATGQIDLATAPQLARALARAQREDVTEIVVDLSAVEFLDSTGVGVLVRAARDATRTGARLYLRGAQGAVAQVLEITGVAAHLPPPPDPHHH